MTKKEYLTKMVEECLGVKVQDYDGSEKIVCMKFSDKESKYFQGFINVDARKDRRNNIVLLDLWTNGGYFDEDDAQKLKEYMEDHGTGTSIVESTSNRTIRFQCETYPWWYQTQIELQKKEQPKAKPEVTEIIRLREENRSLKARLKELEEKLGCSKEQNDHYDLDKEPEPEEVHKVHVFSFPFLGFGFGFGW